MMEKMKSRSAYSRRRQLFGVLTFLFVALLCSIPSSASAFTLTRGQNQTGLVAWWTFDGKDMTPNVMDMSGQGNHGDLSGQTSTTTVAGKLGQALNFDGVNDSITTGRKIADHNGTFSASLWFNYKASGSTYYGLISEDIDTTKKAWNLQVNGEGYVRYGQYDGTAGSSRTSTGAVFSPNTWVHVTITRTDTEVKVYVNGSSVTLDSSVATDGGSNIETSYFRLGVTRTSFANTTLDDVRIYSRALSTAEVLALYNQGAGGKFGRVPTTALANGLVGYWTFDGKDMPSGRANDVSGNGNHGNAINIATSTFYTEGKVGQGLRFDGVDDKVIVPTNAALNPSVISVSFWSNIPSYIGTLNNTIIEIGSGVNSFRVRDASGKLQLIANAGATTLSGTDNSLVYGQWTHWVFIANSSGWFIYKNGVFDASNTTAYVAGANAQWNIGGSAYYNKQTLDEVRIYNRTLSAAEILTLYNLSAGGKQNKAVTPPAGSGLVGYWTFDGKDMPSGRVNDVSGNGRHGNLVNISTSTFYAEGKIGQGLYFDGVDDHVLFSADHIGTGTVTTCAWIYPTSSTAFGSIIGNVQYNMHITSSGVVRVTSNNATTNAVSASAAYTVGQWNHVCAVRLSAGTATLYVNGELSGTPDQTNTIVASGFTMAIGVRGSSALLPFPGRIDDVRLYGKALTAGEIKQLYSMGR